MPSQIISLLGQPSPEKSVDLNSASLINWYLTTNSEQGKYQLVAYPTPGLTTFASGMAGNARALFEEHGVLYAIGGNKLYSIDSSGTKTVRGTLNTSSGFAKIRGINDGLLIADGTNVYSYTISTATFAQIADANAKQTAPDIATQDEFGITISLNSQSWNSSTVSDLTTWPALATASVTGNQSNLVAIATLHREIWLFQSGTTEVWDNLGTANFTFGRNQSVFIEWGCAAKQSVANGDNTLFLLGQSITGGVQVVRMGAAGGSGYNPMIISTPAINYQISTYTTISDAIGFCYQQEGHEFYVLTFPTAAVTWVYDITMQVWHQRQSLVASSQTRWLPSCYAFAYNKQLIGDYQSGTIYQLDMTNYQENGSAITRTLVSHPFYNAGNWTFVDRLQVDWDEGANSASNTMSLFISRDGGRTFGSAKTNNLAGAGTMISGNRVWYSRLGAAKTWVIKITTSMNALAIILGAWAVTRSGEF